MVTDPGSSFILAFQALPLVLVIGALSSLLFHWKILSYIVKGLSFVLQKILNIGGALGLGHRRPSFWEWWKRRWL
jgi:CNT family concentrative nucleoside transporter